MAAFERRTYSSTTLQKIKHDHAKIVQENKIKERSRADENLKELGSYLSIGESHDSFPVADIKYTTALHSQVIESKKPNWSEYECCFFGRGPLERYSKPEEIDLKKKRYLQTINNFICSFLLECINERKPIPLEEKKEWMIELCKYSNPVLSYISKIEEFTHPLYPSLIFEAHAFEIPYMQNAKIYVILVKSTKIDGLLVADYFFYYF